MSWVRVFVLLLLFSGQAGAYCRSTTCDSKVPPPGCTFHNGCATAGVPLAWEGGCVTFVVQQDGSRTRNVGWQDADRIIRKGFSQWVGAKCPGGGSPALQVFDLDEDYGPAICDEPEFNLKEPNANVWMFRDQDWPYPHPTTTLALTTVTSDPASGRILDVDVEINSYMMEITTKEQGAKFDLQSIVTHEAGHFLGLGHSDDRTATMYPQDPEHALDLRSLARDDVEGICAAYPPNAAAPDCRGTLPPHGFSLYCGSNGTAVARAGLEREVGPGCSCRVGERPASESPGWASVAALAFIAFARNLRAKGNREPCRADTAASTWTSGFNRFRVSSPWRHRCAAPRSRR